MPMKTETYGKSTDLRARLRALLRQQGARRAGGLLLRFGLGLLLSQAVVFDAYAPFGVGFVAAGGVGLSGMFGLLGVFAGYAFFWGMGQGLKYIAEAVLVFAAAMVFQSLPLAKKPFFAPLTALCVSSFVGIVFVASEGFELTSVLLFLTELLLIAGSGYFFRAGLSRTQTMPETERPPLDLRRLFGILTLVSCSFLSLSHFSFFGGISPARGLCVLFVMLLAYRGGMGAGSASGLCMGLALDLQAGVPFFSMSYGLTGLIGGLFSGAGKLLCASACVVSTAVAALWSADPSLRLYVMLETFIASILFMLLSDKALPFLDFTARSRAAEDPTRVRRTRDFARRRLSQAADGFRDLFQALVDSFSKLGATNDEDIATVFDRTSDRVCKHCALTGICWDREASSTFQALSDTAAVMLRRGSVDASDFPVYFSSRCLNFQRFVSTANAELMALLYRRQYKNRLRESRVQVCRQYAELSHILQDAADEVGADCQFDWGAERQVEKYVLAQGVEAGAAVFRGGDRRLRLEIEGDDLSPLLVDRAATTRDLSRLLDVPLQGPEHRRGSFGERLELLEAEPLTASLGVAAHKKQGQSISGDSGTYFKTDDGRLFVLLSDGMGSGKEAAAGSNMAVRLLEKFLRAGVAPETALRTLHSALVLRGEETPGFVTVDLLQANLFTGELVFYKYGAAPSYIKRRQKVSRVTGSALPAGLHPGGAPLPLDITQLKAGPKDFVVLVSDGVADAAGDEWLLKALEEWPDGSPRQLAAHLLETATEERGRTDDMTVLALALDRRKAFAEEDNE